MDKNNFEDIIKTKLTDWEAEVPADCWGAIERRITRRRPFYARPFFRYASLAAAIAGIVFVVTLVNKEQSEVYHALVQSQVVEPSAPLEIEKSKEEEPIIKTRPATRPQLANFIPKKQSTVALKDSELEVQVLDLKEDEVASITNEVPKEDEAKPTVETSGVTHRQTKKDKKIELPSHTQVHSEDYVPKKKRDAGFAVNLMASNALPGSTRENESDKLSRSKVEGMQLYSSQQSVLKYNHKMPLSVGLSVEKKVSNTWGIETGVNYSFLKSTFHSIENTTRKGKRELHYLGIPLNVLYRFAKVGNFSFYTSAGAEVDFCFAGKNIFENSNNKNVKNLVSQDEKDKPQWSVHWKAGVSYAFIKQLELYAEPGLAYYFKNDSEVSTVWKDKPFNFALNIGLRTNF